MPVSPRKSIGRKRFVTLIKHLETLKSPESFDFGVWGEGALVRRAGKLKTYSDPNDQLGWGPDGGYEFAETKVHGACGTIGCVLGHAAFEPSLRKLGVRLIATVSDDGSDNSCYSADVAVVNRKGEIEYAGAEDIGRNMFGLDFHRTQIVFFPGSTPSTPAENASAKEVAKFLRAQVKEIDANEGWAI